MSAITENNSEMLKEKVQKKFAEIRAALEVRERLLLRQIDVITTSKQQMRCGATRTASNKTTTTNDTDEVNFIVEQEEELLAAIRSFGRFQLDNINLTLQDVYLRNEDYICPVDDHETMYKCLQQCNNEENHVLKESAEEQQAIVVDFSKNKSIIEHNTKNMNESIINITLQEAKELIKKTIASRGSVIPPLNLEELDDELESFAEAVSSLERESIINTKSSQPSIETKKPKKSRFKPKITINNCNGTINLRNISSLTINCATEEAISAEIPLAHSHKLNENDKMSQNTSKAKVFDSSNSSTNMSCLVSKSSQPSVTLESSSTENSTPTTTASNSNYSSTSSSRSQSKKQKHSRKVQYKDITSGSTAKSVFPSAQPNHTAYPYEMGDEDDDGNTIACDFYNRLLNEIKNSLREKVAQPTDNLYYMQNTNTAEGCSLSASNCDNTGTQSASSASSATIKPNKRLVLRNFENLKIILEANSDEESFHPIQIEQWLAEIISETDLEPMQNTDILEHSKIRNEST